MSKRFVDRRLVVALCFLAGCGPGAQEISQPAAQAEARSRAQPGTRRALLVGISDYLGSASGSAARRTSDTATPRGTRGWWNLHGPVNDVEAMHGLLVAAYGFAPADVVTLTDQAATREAILAAVSDHLVEPARAGDTVVFFFAGHGSRVKNSLSDEPDGMDESIVPADSERGAPDIRDKELRRAFNQILDRGAHLTVILDSCHSGSGARGLAVGDAPRRIEPEARDVADGLSYGPRPEDRGALVLSAAQDFDAAWETQAGAKTYGAFSLALRDSMLAAAAGEAAEDTFLRARARLQADKPFQEPILAGNAEARRSPLFGERTDRRSDRTVVAVERVQNDGTVLLQGGWANGLAVGSELLLPRAAEGPVRLEVTEVSDPGRSKARVLRDPGRDPGGPAMRTASAAPKPGALAEVVSWVAPPGPPLKVWLPTTPASPEALAAVAGGLAEAARAAGLGWVTDPTQETPTHVLRWRDGTWELLEPDHVAVPLGAEIDAAAVVARLGAEAKSLFVQLPAPSGLAQSIVLGPGTRHSGVEPVARPQDALYVLAGRLGEGKVEFAWVRPHTGAEDRARSDLPVRTDWHTGAWPLERSILSLRKIHAWHHLPSPPGGEFPYRLALVRARDGEVVEGGTLGGDDDYGLRLLSKSTPPPSGLKPRYVYAFLIDSHGSSVLLFPTTSGSVENRFPLRSPPPAEIPLGTQALLKVTPPYGVDSYFLLTTKDPLPNPWILEWSGVRTRGPQGETSLEELLSITGGTTRSAASIRTPRSWSIERTRFESVPPQDGR